MATTPRVKTFFERRQIEVAMSPCASKLATGAVNTHSEAKPGVTYSSASVSGNSTMSTGFFTMPPTMLASGGHQFLTTTVHQSLGEYMCGLSFVFLGTSPVQDMALVDTAAQRGLVGQDTLERHDHPTSPPKWATSSMVPRTRGYGSRSLWARRTNQDRVRSDRPRREEWGSSMSDSSW